MDKLKIFMMSLALMTMGLVATSCSSDDNDPTQEGDGEMVVAPASLEFKQPGGTLTLSVQNGGNLQVSSNADWCTVKEESSTSQKTRKFSVTATPNGGDEERTATITVSGNKKVEVSVVQAGSDLIVEEGYKVFDNIPAEGGTFSVKLKVNGTPTVSISDGWISETTGTRAMQELTRTFAVSANYGAARTGSITFSLNGVEEAVSVTQLEGSLPDVGMESDAKTLAARMYAGINIGNTMEVPGGETGWGNPEVAKAYIDGLKTLGFNAVRIPCAWDSHVSDKATNTIAPAWLDRVHEVVGYCVANDMYAIVNIHWDGGWLEENVHKPFDAGIDKKMHDYWTQIANRLGEYDEHLLFAGMNEPGQQNGTDNAIGNIIRYQQTFIDAVRATGGKNALRVLVVQAPNTNIDLAVDAEYRNHMPVDVVPDRLMAEVHFYDPSDFTILPNDDDWYVGSRVKWYWGIPNLLEGSSRNATWGDESYVASQFAKMKKAYADNGIPVILGEYSAAIRTNADDMDRHHASRAYWNEVVTREAKNNGCVPFYWETGGDVNRNTGAAKEAYAIDGIMKGASEGTYPF